MVWGIQFGTGIDRRGFAAIPGDATNKIVGHHHGSTILTGPQILDAYSDTIPNRIAVTVVKAVPNGEEASLA